MYVARECWELKISFKFALLKSAPDAPGAPDKLSHNFFGRHTAFRHIICEKSYENSSMKIRYGLYYIMCYAFKTLIVLLSHLVHTVHLFKNTQTVPKKFIKEFH